MRTGGCVRDIKGQGANKQQLVKGEGVTGCLEKDGQKDGGMREKGRDQGDSKRQENKRGKRRIIKSNRCLEPWDL